MIQSGPATNQAGRYALGASVVAAASGLALLALGFVLVPTWVQWCMLGWAPMVVIGVAGGARLAFEHGSPGSGFIVVLVTCILLRLLSVGVGAVVAAQQGGAAPWSYLVGVAVGFVPLQIFEATWFHRAGRNLACDIGARRGSETEYGGEKAAG